MGGWVKVVLGMLVAALVAVLVISFTSGDDSTSTSTPTVADGQPNGSVDANEAGKKASKASTKDEGGQNSAGANSAVGSNPAEELPGLASPEEPSGSPDDSSGKGSNGGKVGGSGNASHGSGNLGKAKKKKKKKSKTTSPPSGLDPETAAASAVLVTYMTARGAGDWPTACAQMTPKAIGSLERFAAGGKGCVATFSAVYPHLEPGAWASTMTGPIASLRVTGSDGIAIYHGTTGRDYSMPMRKEGGTWKVAAIGPVAVS
jgi:hypothetical protein